MTGISRTNSDVANHGAPLKLDGLEGLIGIHLGIAYSLILADLEPKLRQLGLTPKLAAILWLVGANPDVTQSSLSQFFRLERSTINTMVKRLVGNGQLSTAPLFHDARKLGLRITHAGQESLLDAKQMIWQHEARLASKTGEDHRPRLVECLELIIDGFAISGERSLLKG